MYGSVCSTLLIASLIHNRELRPDGVRAAAQGIALCCPESATEDVFLEEFLLPSRVP